MIRLIWCELSKIWRKRSFVAAIMLLLTVNLFMNWYRNLSSEETAQTREEKQMEEYRKVSGYQEYLEEAVKKKDSFDGISIFGNSDEDTFSRRNIDKSVRDYEQMDDVVIEWQPSHGVTSAMENGITDILLFPGMLLFVGGLIAEEKEKKLFYITYATRRGRAVSMSAKLVALLVHSLCVSGVMIGSDIAYSAFTEGIGKLTVSIQSLAPYMESCFAISVLEYMVLSIVTKGVVLFCFGAILTAVATAARRGYAAGLAAVLLLAGSGLMYRFIPAYSALNPLKYMNFIGMMKTNQLYGAYLNLNMFGYPISRTVMTWIVLAVVASVMTAVCIIQFVKGRQLNVHRTGVRTVWRFRPHGNVLRYEAYKLLIMNRALLILLFFAFLLGGYGLSREYHLSAAEEYYQQFMMRLEGTFDKKKEEQILAERERFAQAQAQIEQIDEMVQDGKLDVVRADAMKMKWESVRSLYPGFERVEIQYKRIKESGGEFIYDTGFLYLCGRQDNSMLICLLLQSVCMVFAFYNAISMEYQVNSWKVTGPTACGQRTIITRKVAVCLMGAAFITVVPWVFRGIGIARAFPLHGLYNQVQDIPVFGSISIRMPVVCFLIWDVFVQMMSVMLSATLVLAISAWRKNNIQSLFVSLLILVIPLVLKLVGFSQAGWISVYPLYALYQM